MDDGVAGNLSAREGLIDLKNNEKVVLLDE
jgi:hypothetical protein